MNISKYFRDGSTIYFQVQNTWGKEWGINGNFYLKSTQENFRLLNLIAVTIENQ
jgi:C1A family cysteine protease